MRITPDDRLTRELRNVLDEVDEALARRPAPSPPWEQIHAFVRLSRTRRRRRVVLAVVSVAMVVTALFVVQEQVFGPGRDRSAPSTPTPTPTAIDGVRGNLAGDQAFLDELTRWAGTHDVFSMGPSTEAVPELSAPATDVSVEYTSDIGGWRVAVVHGRWPEKSKKSYQVGLYGPAGASADQLTPGGFGPSRETTGPSMHVYSQGVSINGVTEAEARAMGAAGYVLADGPVDVVLQEPPTIAADGTVTQHSRTIDGSGGLYEVALQKPGHYALLAGGYYQDFFTEPGEVVASLVDAAPSRGGEALPASQVTTMAERTWLASRQPFAQGRWRVLAAEPGEVTKTQDRALAGVLTLPGGARILAAGHISAPYGKREGGPHSVLDVAQLLPAGDDADLAVACKFYRDLTNGTSDEITGAGALGPAGTATAEWTGPDGVTTSPAVNTLARTDRADVTSVRFLDASGQELGTAPVREPEASRYTMDMAEKDGHPFETRPGWLLPEVVEGLAGF